ncbi:hypothetical protein JXA88_18870 [Candidatus Fermentibacteria bacterium]|nr:hypothetical protein [Candidatus Fermentibacteria bacterium]
MRQSQARACGGLARQTVVPTRRIRGFRLLGSALHRYQMHGRRVDAVLAHPRFATNLGTQGRPCQRRKTPVNDSTIRLSRDS